MRDVCWCPRCASTSTSVRGCPLLTMSCRKTSGRASLPCVSLNTNGSCRDGVSSHTETCSQRLQTDVLDRKACRTRQIDSKNASTGPNLGKPWGDDGLQVRQARREENANAKVGQVRPAFVCGDDGWQMFLNRDCRGDDICRFALHYHREHARVLKLSISAKLTTANQHATTTGKPAIRMEPSTFDV